MQWEEVRKQCECPDTPEKHLPGQTPENAHSVRRRILRMLGFEPEQIICPGSFYACGYPTKILFPLYISAKESYNAITIS